MNKKWWCLFGVHEYKTIKTGPFERSSDFGSSQSFTYYEKECLVCGKMKQVLL